MAPNMDIEIPTYLRAIFPNSLTPVMFHLGQLDQELRFTVTVDAFSSRSPLLVLHAGSTVRGPVLASVSKPAPYKGTYRNIVKIQSPISNTGAIEVSLTTPIDDGMHVRYNFSLAIGSRHEKFEWRATRGSEVHVAFRNAKGFKLVRLGSEGPGGGQGGSRATRAVGETSDGKEVVAVWATEKSLLPAAFVPNCRPFKFELLGSGKALGQEFACLALTTALRVWSSEAQAVPNLTFDI
ncbi:uncharacterized protein F4822DRAFT_439399 [Hypoxylon trugodes]|uniref:uncharacterized protein n=1 Tax=Hypoxylon trugodes TaxID=326681 RepID=UPI0021982E16|nr:uncharacterized protein F4822DRAFT_439399 [Hypoxylon trugodes]KAI1393240.1 hypothetical protein F4822DRAFT_439399 [Hypoxylon trugodes]